MNDEHLHCLCFDKVGEAGEESSDSDGEQEETSHKLIRKVSTSGQIRAKVGIIRGYRLSTVPCGHYA